MTSPQKALSCESSPESISRSEATSETSILRGPRDLFFAQEQQVGSASTTQTDVSKHEKPKSTIISIKSSRHPLSGGAELETIVSEYSKKNSIGNTHLALIQCRSLAILLRFRVAQIASGSCTFLLGCVALLDTATRGTLSFALLAGLFCIITASLHTSDCRRKGIAGLVYICPGLRVTLLVVITFIINSALLVVDSVCVLSAENHNLRKLGLAQAVVCIPWNCLEFTTVVLRIIWAKRASERFACDRIL